MILTEFCSRRRLPITTLLSLLALSTSVLVVSAQNFYESGPYATSSYSKGVILKLPGRNLLGRQSKNQQMTITITHPTADRGPFPLVLMFNGFECRAKWYTGIVTRVASWGYTVVQYDLPVIKPLFLGEKEEATYLQSLLDWLATEVAPGSSSPAAGRVDFSRKAVMGHSRGGKMAALHYATRDDLATAVLFDPVDCFLPGENHPSAIAALGNVTMSCGLRPPALTPSDKTAAVIGAGYMAWLPCNPPEFNYAKFAGVLGAGTWKVLINEAGHMQFPDSSNILHKLMAFNCGKGDIKTPDVVQGARTIAVAWLESTFRPYESGMRLEAFWQWMQEQAGDGTLEFEVLTSAKEDAAGVLDVPAGGEEHVVLA